MPINPSPPPAVRLIRNMSAGARKKTANSQDSRPQTTPSGCDDILVSVGGIEFHGYARGGPVLSYDDNVKGGLSLGCDLQKYRLGNEGDNGIEIDLIKNFEAGGMKWKVHYMPAKWNSGAISTEQAYVEMSGL
jgi:hypothetical protein